MSEKEKCLTNSPKWGMDKAKQIAEVSMILWNNIEGIQSSTVEKVVKMIFDKDYRNMSELKEWLKKMIEKSEKLSKDENGNDIEIYCGASSAYIQILDHLEGTNG
jgi:hypothetical protein